MIKRKSLKERVDKWILFISDFLIRNIYVKPKMIIGLLVRPSKIWEETYFPELPRKGKIRILWEQIVNICRHTTIEEYYFMYGLDVKRSVKNNEYVTYREFMEIRDYLNLSNPHNDSTILRNKLFFESVARSIGIPTPDNIAYSDNGRLILLHKASGTFVGWNQVAQEFPEGFVYMKPIDGECGSGILKIEIRSDNIFIDGQAYDGDYLKNLCRKGHYIFQARLVQHPEMSRIYPYSVNTIRMTTVRNLQTGEIEILPPTLRIGAHGSYIDNFSKGGVIVAMDTKSGKLDEWGFFKPMYGFKSKVHPDTNVEFSSFIVPFYQEAKEVAKFFHSFLNLHSIGWDIAITDNGPVFIEGNDNWEINLPQTFNNPFKKEFDRLFSLD